jgi:hypothetical protein
MGEAIFGLLQVVGLVTGKRLLPWVSGGRVILMPQNASSEPFRLAPYKRLPNGQIGVDLDCFAPIAALFYLLAIVGLCSLFL